MNESDEVQLTPGGKKRLGNLVNLKEMKIPDAIRQRGGGQTQVEQLRTDYQNNTNFKLK